MRIVSLRLRRVEYSTRSLASLSNRASCIGSYHSTSTAGRNRLMLHVPNNFRRESAIETVAEGKRTLLLNNIQRRRTVENSAQNLFILFRLKAAGALNKSPIRRY